MARLSTISACRPRSRAIAGARFYDDNDFNSGSAYVFDLAALVCNGLAVTVELNRARTPTSGDDVILGTPAGDTR